MSLRIDVSEKSLKGFIPGASTTTTDSGDTSATTRAATNVLSSTLENVNIFSGTADDLLIGSAIPAPATFSELVVGRQGGESGPVTFWGNNMDDFVSWDPDTAVFDISGSLIVRDDADFGNIRIHDNTIEAIRPVPTGDINLLPQPQGQIAIAGNLSQTASGFVHFDNASSFTVKSSGTSSIDSYGSSRFSSRGGSLTLSTTYPSVNVAPILRVTEKNDGSKQVVVTSVSPHQLAVNDLITITGSNSSPVIDGIFNVLAVPDANSFTIQLSMHLITSGTQAGTFTKVSSGSIYLQAGTSVEVDKAIPLRFGHPRASITGNVNGNNLGTLLVSSDFLTIDDPIPVLQLPSNVFSDSGISIKYSVNGVTQTGFFGFLGSTQYFTWIPKATVVRNADGTKTVTGTRGTMSLEGLVSNTLSGDPDLILKATRDIILQPGRQFTSPVSIPFKFGNATLTPTNSGNLQIATSGDVQISPTVTGKGLVLTRGSPIVLDGTTASQSIIGSATGLTISSPNMISLSTPMGGVVQVSEGSYLVFGNNTYRRIYGDVNGLNLESPSDIYLRPSSTGGVVNVPIGTRMTFGSNNDYIVGQGNTIGMTLHSSGNLSLTSDKNVVLSPVGSVVQSTAGTLQLPLASNVTFGNIGSGTGITSTSTSLTMQAGVGPLNLNGNTAINLTAPIVNVPMSVPLTFGGRGAIIQTPTGGFTISTVGTDPLNINAGSTIVSGDLQVMGQITYIASTTTTFRDPILHLGRNAPMGDITDKGIEFEWWDGPYSKLGALFWDRSESTFVLASEASNTNEVLTASVYGNLRLNALQATNITTVQFNTNRITGTPDLYLVANGGSIFLQPSNSVQIPLNIPIQSSGGNSIVCTTSGWNIASPTVTIPNGNLTVGNATLRMTDINNFRIGGIPNVAFDTLVNVQSTIGFGIGQVKVGVDNHENLTLTSPSNIILTTNTIFNGGMTMGNAFMSWASDVPGGRVLWRNTNITTPLYLSIIGAIYDAEWKGKPIGLAYGGTGHEGSWHAGSVVFVDTLASESFLQENNASFFWDNTSLRLGIRTSVPAEAISVGTGNMDFMSDTSNIYWRHSGYYAFGFGKTAFGNILSIKTTTLPTTDTTLLQSCLSVSAYGQVGIGVSDLFMSSLSGRQTEARLYVSGDLQFTDFANKLAWSSSTLLNCSSDGQLHVYSPVSAYFHTTAFHGIDAQFYESTSRIFGTQGGNLNLTSSYATRFLSPHNVFVYRCCYRHDPVTNICQSWTAFDPTLSHLDIINTVGNISFSPLTSVNLVNETSLVFNNGQGLLKAQDADLLISGTGSILLRPASNLVKIYAGLVFNDKTRLQENLATGRFEVVTNSPIALLSTASVQIPNGTPLQFGDASRRIFSDGQVLTITGSDEVRLDTNIVRITGNLIVEGTTTQRIFFETSLDTGILQLGGNNNLSINGMSVWSQASTVISTTGAHYLNAGDTVTLTNTNPDVDGTYVISNVPTATTFVLPFAMPAIDAGSPIQGSVQSALVMNPNSDVGIQVNWHTGTTIGTSASRIGFFGFRRSTQRLTYFREATRTGNIFTGILGDAEFGGLYVRDLAATNLVSNLNTGTFAVSGTNFLIGGGSINNTPIGSIVPSSGRFTNLSIDGNLIVSSTNPVLNLNADMVDGKHALDFVYRDGSLPLTANWNTGTQYGIIAPHLADTSLSAGSIVYAANGGYLASSTSFFFDSDTLHVPYIGAFTLAGNVAGGSFTIGNVVLSASNIIDSNMTLGPLNTFDATRGKVLFANGQLSGNWLAGGTGAIDISGTAALVRNGVYTTNFGANTILKSDTVASPVSLTVNEGTLVGRPVGGVITSLNAKQVRDMINVAEAGSENVYLSGSVMRDGNLAYPDASKMNALFFFSFERVNMQSDQTVTLDVNKQVSYVSVTFSSARDTAIVVVPNGIADGQFKYIIVSSLATGTRLRISCPVYAPYTSSQSYGFEARSSGSSASLIWDHVGKTWFIAPSGMVTIAAPFV